MTEAKKPKKGAKKRAAKTTKAKAKEGKLSAWAQRIDEHIRARIPILYIVTWEEERALRELESIAISQRKRFHVWSQTEGLGNPALPDKELERRSRDPLIMLDGLISRHHPEILVALDLHAFLNNHAVLRRLRDTARRLIRAEKTLVIVAPRLELPSDLSKEITVLDLPLPTREELTTHLRAVEVRLTGSMRGAVHINKREREELVRSGQGMTLQEFEQTLALANIRNGRIDREAIPIMLREKQQILRKSSTLEWIDWEAEFSSIGGLDLLKEFVLARREAFTERARDFGLPAPKGICLIGVQGCGKSLTAKAVARVYRLPLVRLDMGRLFGGLVGKSEENARIALRLAESLAPCVLWIDELEKGFAGMGSSNVSDGGTTARVIGTMTTWLQERDAAVYVVATSNDITQLPPELLRKGRFDEIFFVDLPALGEREEIFRIHLEKRDRAPGDFDVELLASLTSGFSGAEIEQVIIAGLYDAFNARRPLATEDLARAIRDTVPLSEMMREQIDKLREWAGRRARRASSVVELGLDFGSEG